METETIIIDFKIEGDVQKKLAETTAEIKRLKAQQKELNDFIRNGADVNGEMAKIYAENAQRIKELTAAEKTYTAQLNTTTAADREYGDSIYQLSAQLADLKNQYRGLTKAQRESAEGNELLSNIQSLDKEIKGLDASLGDHQRNVGNYVSALTGLDSRVVKVAAVFQGGFKQGLQAAGTALKSFGKAILTTPIGWIAAAVVAVVAVFNKLKEAFKRNDEASTQLSAAFAKLQPIITAINKVFSVLVDTIAKVVTGIMNVATAIVRFFVPSFKEASKEAENLVKAQDALEDSERKYTVAHAEREKEIAELNKKARSDNKLTAKEREDIYKKIDQLELKDLAERKKIAAENLRILEARAKQEVDTSDEMKDKIASAKAAMLQADTDYTNATMKNAQRQAAALKEQIDAAKKRAETTTAEIRKMQDLQIAMINDAYEQQKITMQKETERQIEDLKYRLKTEKDLSKKAREAINSQILLITQKLNKDLAELAKQRAIDTANAEAEEWAKVYELQIRLIKDAGAKEQAEIKNNYTQQIQSLQRRLENEKELTENQRNAINRQILLLTENLNADLEKLTKEEIIKRYNLQRQEEVNELQRRLIDIHGNAVKENDAKLEAAETYYNSLLNMDADTKAALYKNETEYTAAVLQAEAAMQEAREANAEALQAQTQNLSETLQTVTGAMSDLFEAAAGDSAQYEQFRKAMAIVDATISLGESLAKAVTMSMEGDPYTVALRIAANVAAVTAQFASLIATIKSATIPSAPAFAGGGVVGGHSLTGDTVMIRANSGEMIINKEQQAKLFDYLANGMPTSSYEALKAAMVEAFAAMPSPILDYSEFTGFQRSVQMVQKRTKLI